MGTGNVRWNTVGVYPDSCWCLHFWAEIEIEQPVLRGRVVTIGSQTFMDGILYYLGALVRRQSRPGLWSMFYILFLFLFSFYLMKPHMMISGPQSLLKTANAQNLSSDGSHYENSCSVQMR